MMKRKGIALILAVLVVSALSLPSMAQVNPFTDVRSDHWAYDAILVLSDAGLIEGYPDGTFGGDRTFTRYEMAMVFARMLARFENQIEEKIASELLDANARIEQLSAAIQSTSEALEAKIVANYDELVEEIAKLKEADADLQTDVAVLKARIDAGGVGLSAEAQAVLADQALENVLAALAELEEDQSALASRILRLEGSTPSRAEAQLIAEKVVIDALAGLTGDLEGAEGAVSLDEDALAQLLEGQVEDVDAAIRALAQEYRPELESLGVRMDEVEARLLAQESDIQGIQARLDAHDTELVSIWDRIGNVRLTGRYESDFERTRVRGTAGSVDKIDPRDDDSDTISDEDKFEHAIKLSLTSTPADNVTVKADFTLVRQLFDSAADNPRVDTLDALDLRVTTPGLLRVLHLGKLDEGMIASSFDKYTLVARSLEEGNDKAGADFQLVSGDLGVDGFMTKVGHNRYILGVASRYNLFNAFDLTLRGVQHTHTAGGVGRDGVYSAEIAGNIGGIDFSAMGAHNYRHQALAGRAAEVHASTNLGGIELGGMYGGVGTNFQPLLSKGAHNNSWLKSYENQPDWVDRHINSYDWLKQGEKEAAGWAGFNVAGIDAKLTVGQRDDAAGVNGYFQGQAGFELAGIGADVLFDQRRDGSSDSDTTFLIGLNTSILGVDVGAKIIDRTNDQAWAPAGEEQQRQVVVDGSTTVDFVLPLKLEGRFGTSRSASNEPHLYARVGVDEYDIGGIKLNAGYSASRNDLDADWWWRNSAWTNVNKNVLDFGASFEIANLLGFRIKPGYELKMVWAANGGTPSLDGTPRHTLKGDFEKALWEGRLSGGVKYVMGGTVGEYGNDRDLTANVDVSYPVFSGADLTLGGKYVSSLGNKRDDYKIYNVKAGLSFSF